MTRLTTFSLVLGLFCLIACTPPAVQNSEPRDLSSSATGITLKTLSQALSIILIKHDL